MKLRASNEMVGPRYPARLRGAGSGWTGRTGTGAIAHDRSRKFISDFPGGTEIRERRKIDLPSDLLPRTNKANIERGPRHSTEQPIGSCIAD